MKALLLILLSASVFAATGFLVDEYTKGSKRYCVYDAAGEEIVITVDAYELCPLTIEE